MTKHLGRDLKGESLVVCYMLMPESKDKALVVRPSKLQHHMQRTLMNLLSTQDSQASTHFADVLGRRMYEDSGKYLLQVLHEIKALEPISIDEVVMTPASNVTFPLRSILENMGVIKTPTLVQTEAMGFNPYEANAAAEVSDERLMLAKNLLIEAKMLDDDANMKRESAYKIAPQLRPRKPEPLVEPKAEVVEPAVEGTNNNGE